MCGNICWPSGGCRFTRRGWLLEYSIRETWNMKLDGRHGRHGQYGPFQLICRISVSNDRFNCIVAL